MFQTRRYGLWWKLGAVGAGMLVALMMPRPTAAQSDAQRPLNQYEKNAIQVVSDWTAAWQAHDPDKMADYVADDIKFRLDPSESQMRMGKAKFLCQMRGMAGGGNLTITNPSYYAVGDSVYVLVIQRRTDRLQGGRRGGPAGQGAGGPEGGANAAPPGAGPGRAGGPPPGLAGPIPVGAFFVVKNGKIAEWLDSTLAFDITTLPARGPGAGQNCQ